MHYLKIKKTLHASRYLLWSQCAPSEVLFFVRKLHQNLKDGIDEQKAVHQATASFR